jgi:transposase
MNTYGKKSREFKFEVMRQHYENNVSINELAKRFGVSRQTVYGWRNQYRQYGANAFIGCGHDRAADDELMRLRSENERLRRENRSLRNQIKQKKLGSETLPADG